MFRLDYFDWESVLSIVACFMLVSDKKHKYNSK